MWGLSFFVKIILWGLFLFLNNEARIHHIGMRHFDPASEDDMDDNGMSRYMESNDDEGWE